MANLKDLMVMGPARFLDKIYGNLIGNASTATKLQTARTINGTSFNGSADITTSYWGTTRTLTIGNKGQSVNGSANIVWSLNDIGALPLTGGTISKGSLHIDTASGTTPFYIFRYNSTAESTAFWQDDSTLHINMTNDETSAAISFNLAATDTENSDGSRASSGTVTFSMSSGVTTITANNFSGNASSATKLATARTITTNLASTSGASFDGTSNITPGVTGVLAIGNGGTGTSTAPVQGGVIYASSTSAYASTAVGSSGQLLQSAGTGKPTWITATNSNTASTIVKRDSSGNFSAGTITATLNGNASTASQLGAYSTAGQYTKNTLAYFNANLANSGTAVAGSNDSPSTSVTWWHFLRFTHSNSSGYYTDLAIPFNSTSLYYKRITAGSVANSSTNAGWIQVLDVLNYSSTLDGRYLKLSGGTMNSTAQIIRSGVSKNWVLGRDGALIRINTINGYSPIISIKTTNGSWEIGAYDQSTYADKLIFSYATDTNYTSSNNTTAIYTITNGGHFSGSAEKANYVTDLSSTANSIGFRYATITSPDHFAAWSGRTIYAITNTIARTFMSAMSATLSESYYGMGQPDGNTTNWIRTTTNGIIPATSGGASALGTEGWPFNNIWSKRINVINTYHPCLYLTCTTANSASTYTRAYIEGNYGDQVNLWVDSNKTTTANSRRAISLRGYAATSNVANALKLCQCDTAGTWLSDLLIYHQGNIVYSATEPTNPITGMIWLQPV